ncbi:hypothetical protein ASC98_14580 [Rhizobacter sp. Root1238]|nr:hypothetical protein ASC88_07340 [Rhizobacter sp. Root29]KQW15342.1 hypothetical protein ASC98_14580 [Rhizobacter sp. Root1238]
MSLFWSVRLSLLRPENEHALSRLRNAVLSSVRDHLRHLVTGVPSRPYKAVIYRPVARMPNAGDILEYESVRVRLAHNTPELPYKIAPVVILHLRGRGGLLDILALRASATIGSVLSILRPICSLGKRLARRPPDDDQRITLLESANLSQVLARIGTDITLYD